MIRYIRTLISEEAASDTLRFGAGLPYLVKSLNAETGIQTQMVDAVQITDAAFFESPIIFMEPISSSSVKTPERIVEW